MENDEIKTPADAEKKSLMIAVFAYSKMLDGKPQYVFTEEIEYNEYKEKYFPDSHANSKNPFIWDLALNKGFTVGFDSTRELPASHVSITVPTMETLALTPDVIQVDPMDTTLLYKVEGFDQALTDRQFAKQIGAPRAYIKRKLKALRIGDEVIFVCGHKVHAESFRDAFLRNVSVSQAKS